jgi:hypothetical protein
MTKNEYAEMQTKFENEVRQEIKKINNSFVVNLHTYPYTHIKLFVPSMEYVSGEYKKIQQHEEEVEKSYTIIMQFMMDYK